MSALDWIIAVPYFAGGLLVWPIGCLFCQKFGERFRWLRLVFFFTLLVLGLLGGFLGVVFLLGRFNHNWLPLTLLFPLINLASVCVSLVGIIGEQNPKLDDTELRPQWCLVGNIVDERRSGEGGNEIRHGTKHFAPGTKIYAFPAQWGDGYEKIIVVGRHRGSKDFVTMVIKSDWVTNWRAKVVHNPEVLRRLQEGVCRFWEPQNWKGEKEVMKYLEGLRKFRGDT